MKLNAGMGGTLGTGIACAVMGLVLLPVQPAAPREWRDWCGDPRAEPSLGWHFYCDPAARGRTEAESEGRPAVPATAGSDAVAEIQDMRRALEESRARRMP